MRLRLTADGHDRDGIEDLGSLVDDQVEQGRGKGHEVDAPRPDDLSQSREADGLGGVQHRGSTIEQCAPDLRGGHVEREGSQLEDAAALVHRPEGGEECCPVDTSVHDLHALGAARRTRGVVDARDAFGGRGARRIGVAGHQRPSVEWEQARRETAEPFSDLRRLVAEHPLAVGIGDHVTKTFGRPFAVQRYERPPALQDAQQRHQHVGRTRDAHPDACAWPDAFIPQGAGEPVGEPVQIAVADFPTTLDGRGCVGSAYGPVFEALLHAAVPRIGRRRPVDLPMDDHRRNRAAHGLHCMTLL